MTTDILFPNASSLNGKVAQKIVDFDFTNNELGKIIFFISQ